MSTIQTKFVVVGLPRTGTLSICQMLIILGFNCLHPVGPTWRAFLVRNNIDVLADTPMFCPSVIKYVLDSSDDVKFIYLDKSPEAWASSMEKVRLDRNYNDLFLKEDKEKFTPFAKTDYESLYEILGGEFVKEQAILKFDEHKQKIINLIPPSRLLSYTFTEGWKPLCDFVGKEIPNVDIPHINKDTMFDKLVR